MVWYKFWTWFEKDKEIESDSNRSSKTGIEKKVTSKSVVSGRSGGLPTPFNEDLKPEAPPGGITPHDTYRMQSY